ncbi:MAG: tetratricopeptide repeat protein [Clostridiales bacterium]|nr:tetratricopeptide repeat protein [Clostridiales bacterium]
MENEGRFELKVSPVEMCKIDYNRSMEELFSFYDEQNKKIKEGNKEYLNGEFMQLGYALDFIDFVKRIFNVAFDFDEAVIPYLDKVLGTLRGAIVEKKINREAAQDIAKKATGFFSVVVWKNLGGGFISSNIGYGVNVKGINAFVFGRIVRNLTGEPGADMASLYEALKDTSKVRLSDKDIHVPLSLKDETYDQIKALCAEGDEFADAGKYEDALVKYNEAMDLLPEPKAYWDAYLWIVVARGDAYFFLKDFEKMLPEFLLAIKCDGGPDNPFVNLRLGEAYFENGDTENARKYLKIAYEQDTTIFDEEEDHKYRDWYKQA